VARPQANVGTDIVIVDMLPGVSSCAWAVTPNVSASASNNPAASVCFIVFPSVV
jgi:hypothetical protein